MPRMPSAPFLVPRVSAGRQALWPVPGSKSVTNRAFVLAALSDEAVVLDNVLDSDDTVVMRQGLEAMGVTFEDGPELGRVTVRGGRRRLHAPTAPIFVGNSGTTVRFLAGLAVLLPGATTLIGDEHMARRPIADLVEGLNQLGVKVECATGCPPLTVHGGAARGGHVQMRGDRSSQYFTALLLMACLTEATLTVDVVGDLVSRPYIAMTRRMVADFGGRIDETPTGFVAHPTPGFRRAHYDIEPDASSASYPFALAAAGGHRITVPGLTAASLQGDYGFVEVLARMGATVDHNEAGTTITGAAPLAGLDVDMHHISDTVMTLAAIAPLASGPTTIRNVANIRIKETDRLTATVTELRRLGQNVEHGDDWLRITPRRVLSETVECYRDHRIAMSFAVLGLITGGVAIADPACVAKTYPRFWTDLNAFVG